MELERRLHKDLRHELAEPQVLVLTGPRQVGKTTLMRALEADAQAEGRPTRFLDLEQPADLARLAGGGEDVPRALDLIADRD